VSARDDVAPAEAKSGTPPAPARRLVAVILAYAAVAPLVFFLFFLIRGGWLAWGVAVMTFPSSLIWLAVNSVPQGAILGLLVGLLPERWPPLAVGAAALLLGAAMAMANSLWLGLALIDPAGSAVNLAAVGLVGGLASLILALILCYALRRKGQKA
jgi:hypothetical protein